MQESGALVSVAAGGNGDLFEKSKASSIKTFSLMHAARDVNIRKDYKVFRELLALVRREQPDVLHVNSSKLGGIGALVGRITKTPVVFTAHGWPFKERVSFAKRILMWILSWVTALLATSVIAVSQDDFKRGVRMPLVRKKMNQIHLGREVAYLSREEAREILSKHNNGIRENDVSIGVIAELHPNKGHRYLLEAVVQLSQGYQLFLIGAGELLQELKALASELGIEDSVHFLGHIPNAAELLKAFDLFVLPSLKEGLPYVIIEAQAAGLPVVASSVGGIPEIVSDESAILVKPGDVKELSRALEMLVRDAQLRSVLSQGARKRADLFSQERMFEQTKSVYRALNVSK